MSSWRKGRVSSWIAWSKVALATRIPARTPAAVAAPTDGGGEEPRTLVFEIGTEEMPPSEARAALSQVRRSVTERLGATRLAHGDVGTAAIAGAMATTSRSLQRRLTEAGTTFRDVLAYVRSRRRAQLARGGFSETEIARQLGFADARSMRRSLDAE